MKKILIIDDDLVFHKTMSAKLLDSGYGVVSAHDGEEGLAAVAKETPDLILLDVVMPKLGGIEFLKKMQDGGSKQPIPVLITSNFSGLNNIEEGMKLGIRGYIVKSDESLQTIVNNIELMIGKAE